MNDQPDWGSGADYDRRLDIEITRRDLVAGPPHILLGRFPDGADKIAFTGKAEIAANTQQRRDRDALQQPPAVEIDFVGHRSRSIADFPA